MSTAGPVIGSLCTGYGGLDMGVLTAFGGGRIAWVADPDPHVRTVLAARWPGVPNVGDIREVDWSTVEPADVVTAGFPCQDISAAGRRAGIRSGLWHHVARAIDSLRPALVVVENVAALRWRDGGLEVVLSHLADVGYDCVWNSVRASDVGAAHRREGRMGRVRGRDPAVGSDPRQTSAASNRARPAWTAGVVRPLRRVLDGPRRGLRVRSGHSGAPHNCGSWETESRRSKRLTRSAR